MNKRVLAIAVTAALLAANAAQAGFSSLEKVFSKKPPLYSIFARIARLTYRENVMDCSNKASLYVNLLAAAGMDARVLVVKNFAKYGAAPHCLVLLANYDGKGMSVLCDPTADEWFFDADVEKLGEYVRMINAEDLWKNKEFSVRQSLVAKLMRLTRIFQAKPPVVVVANR